MSDTPTNAPKTAADWADELAELIIAESRNLSPAAARAAVAGYLREIEQNGFARGCARGSTAASRTIAALRELLTIEARR
jgi:hypothetical protein